MIVNCNDLWTRMVNVLRRVRRLPVVTNEAPPLDRSGTDRRR